MPVRLVRDGILKSERINRLSAHAELFYRRLMSVVDDYGRYEAHKTLLRASCYPLKLDSVKEDTISKHLAECADAGLIVLYTVEDKEYLEIKNFNQRVRSKSKYPDPSAGGCRSHASQEPVNRAQKPALDEGEDEDEDELSSYQNSCRGDLKKSEEIKDIRTVLEYLNEKTGSNFKPSSKTSQSHVRARLRDGYTVEDMKTVIDLKTEQWGPDPKMVEYLRPQTLFCGKFEGYLQAATRKPSSKTEDYGMGQAEEHKQMAMERDSGLDLSQAELPEEWSWAK